MTTQQCTLSFSLLCWCFCCAAAVHEAGGSAADFNPASPDGNYKLNLGVAAERAVAVQLVELDRTNATDLMKNIAVDGKVCMTHTL